MAILLAALLTAGSVAILAWLPATSISPKWQEHLRRTVALVLTLLPLGFGFVVLASARERTRVLRFDYVGKQLAFGAANPVTAGSSPEESLDVEDLQAPLLGARSVILRPGTSTDPGTAAGDAARPPSAAVLTLRSPSPAVRVDDRYCNSVPLADGDDIVIAPRQGGPPVRNITYKDDQLSWDSGQVGRPSVQALTGGGRVHELAALHQDFAGVYSFLHRPEPFGPWHLLIRSDEVRIERAGMTVATFVAECPVPADFELGLEVVLGGVLRTQRRDRILVGDDQVEVRFGEPLRWARTAPPPIPELTLALGVPSAFAREEMVELPEPSSRFRGLTALYHYDRERDSATVRFLGDKQEVRPGDLYALGTGKDRLLIRLDRLLFPRRLLLDLALLSLFFAVFLARGMTAHAGLAAIVGPVGLLLAHRLLFSHKAANQPPHFTLDAFEEARLALWLVPALLVFGWALAWILRQPASPTPRPASGSSLLVSLGWPLGGLATAAAGAFTVTVGASPGRRALALLPLMLDVLLAMAFLLSRRARIAAALGRLQREGIPWGLSWIALVGALVLLMRLAGLGLGMPETLRLPFSDFRLLWTVLQLPVCAAVAGLALERLRRPAAGAQVPTAPSSAEPERRRQLLGFLPSWFIGFAAFYIFLLLAFVAVAAVAGDTGLVLVHALAPVVTLLLLAFAPPLRNRSVATRLAVVILASLPLLAIIAVNAFPGSLVRIVGWGPAGTEAEDTLGAPVRERAAQLSSTRAQQMFRLYMLANPGVLSEVGLEPAERAAVQYSTLQSYARVGGWLGKGYLGAELPRHLGRTYLSDLVPVVFVLTEFGLAGLLGLALLYLVPIAAVPLTARVQNDPNQLGQQGLYVGLAALLAFTLPGLYMLLANLNLVLFTGKNMSLLALNSLSDVIESGALLALAVVGLSLRRSTV